MESSSPDEGKGTLGGGGGGGGDEREAMKDGSVVDAGANARSVVLVRWVVSV